MDDNPSSLMNAGFGYDLLLMVFNYVDCLGHSWPCIAWSPANVG